MRIPNTTLMPLLFALLAGCASNNGLTAAGPTALDEAADRILVTVDSDSLDSVARLSPSGRLSYLPPAAEETRAAERRRALAIAADVGGTFTLQLEEDWPIPALGVYCFVFRVAADDREQRDEIIRTLARHPDVESAQALNFFHPMATQPDAALPDPLGSAALPDAHLYRRASGRNVEVAIIDTGADLQHEDLVGADVTAIDLVGSNDTIPAEHHGTSVLGVIAAQRQNGKGIGGFAPDARILLLRACWEPEPDNEYAVCNSFTLAKALSRALESGVSIVNLSIAGPRDPLLERLALLLETRGKLLIAAGESRETFPASVEGSVFATRLLPEPSRGTLTLLPDNRYGIRRGSSLQAARITGIAALVKELAPEVDVAALHRQLARLRTESIDVAFAELLTSTPPRTRKVSTAR